MAAAFSRHPDPLIHEVESELEGERLDRDFQRRALDAVAAEAQERWVRFLGGGAEV